MSDPTLVVMAAGLGSRYGGLKQVVPVGPNGETVTDYCVYDALRGGFSKVVFVIRKETESVFRERIGKSIEEHAETVYVFQELDNLPEGFALPPGREKPWGTAHAVLCCKDAVQEPFAAINADDYYGPYSYGILCDYLKQALDGLEGYDYCMTGFVVKKTLSPHGHVARGVCRVTGDNFLVEVTERTHIREINGAVKYAENDTRSVEIPSDSIVSMNMWGLTPSVFTELEARFARFLRERGSDPKAECFLPSVVNELIQEGRARVRVLPTNETWFGVTYKEDLTAFRQSIRERIRQGVYPERLWG